MQVFFYIILLKEIHTYFALYRIMYIFIWLLLFCKNLFIAEQQTRIEIRLRREKQTLCCLKTNLIITNIAFAGWNRFHYVSRRKKIII